MLRFDPSYFNGLHYMGLRLNEQGRYQEALPVWYGCLALRPDDYFSLCFRARTHWKLEQHDEALIDANSIIDKAPDVIDGWTLRGLSYQGLKQFDNAVADFTKAIEVEKSVGFYSLEKSMAYFAELLATAPDAQMRNGAKALELALDACERDAYTDPDLLKILATVYAEQGDYEKAMEWGKKALEETPNKALREDVQNRLEKFEAGLPWRIEVSNPGSDFPAAN